MKSESDRHGRDRLTDPHLLLPSAPQPSKVPADVEMRDSRFHQSLIVEWFGTTVFVLFLALVRQLICG